MRVLVALDKFKDALSARAACAAVAETLRETRPGWSLDLCPLADGGDGFAEVLTSAAGGELHCATVTGPRCAPVEASFGVAPVPAAVRELIGGAKRVAIVEMAQASGLAWLRPEDRDPWLTTSRGTGELIRAAAALGVDGILLGVGGSATHDLGLGALGVLGLECRAADGRSIYPPSPRSWSEVESIVGRFDPALPPITVACDVTNPLLGPLGAATVFAPQKGLRAEDHARLEQLTERMAALLAASTGRSMELIATPGAGAAGGFAFGFLTAAGARLAPGAELVARWLDLDARLAAADLVITGEGRFDESSLGGKGPGELARRAVAAGKRVQVFAGAVSGALAGVELHAITPIGQPLREALSAAAGNLRRAVGGVWG